MTRTQVFSCGYRAWLLGVLFLATALNLADRQGLATVVPAIKAELHLSDTELGLLQGLGFAIFYTLMGLPLARLAEHKNRSWILSASTAVFAGATVLSGACRGFWQLLICRVGVGIGDAGFSPTVASLVGDYYPAQKRASAMTLIWLGAPIGAALGATIGGWVAQHGSWRAWFLSLGVAGFLVATLVLLTVREPIRGLSDSRPGGGTAPPAMRATFRFLLGKRSMRHVLIGAALASVTMNGLGQFWGRFFVSVHHATLTETGRAIGILAIVTMVAGFSLGGFGVERAGRHDRRWYVWGPGIALLLSSPLLLLGETRGSISGTVVILLIGLTLLFVYFTPTLAIAQNMVSANMRASSAFVVAAVLGIVGLGLGPSLTGLLSDLFAQHIFGQGNFKALCVSSGARSMLIEPLRHRCQSASASGIQQSIMLMSLFSAWGAIHYFFAARHFRGDLDTHYSELPGSG